MKLYIYSTLDGQLFDEMEVERYDGEAVHGDFGTMSLSAELEYSSREDLNETLRADWRRAHPSAEALMTAATKVAVMALGVEVALTPEDTNCISIAAQLPPIADGAAWKAGLNLVQGTIVTHGGKNYQVLQGHISQAGWPPDVVPALFKTIAGDFAEWAQPVGSHDAYMLGDKVEHGGQMWESTCDGNVWEPGEYGWEAV